MANIRREGEREAIFNTSLFISFFCLLFTHTKKAYEKGFRLFFVREIKMKF